MTNIQPSVVLKKRRWKAPIRSSSSTTKMEQKIRSLSEWNHDGMTLWWRLLCQGLYLGVEDLNNSRCPWKIGLSHPEKYSILSTKYTLFWGMVMDGILFMKQHLDSTLDFHLSQFSEAQSPVTRVDRLASWQSEWDPFHHFFLCLKMGYTPNYSHLVGIMIINHWV